MQSGEFFNTFWPVEKADKTRDLAIEVLTADILVQHAAETRQKADMVRQMMMKQTLRSLEPVPADLTHQEEAAQ